jgi:phosphohistidine phosphatase
MKRLFLLRHAKSSWNDPAVPDHDRPLAPRGLRASTILARHLQAERISPDLILCSSSRRTRQTLDGIANSIGHAEVRIEHELYAASHAELMTGLRDLNEGVGSVMLIGHDPAIQEVALELAREGPGVDRMRRKFPTAALATLTFSGAWRDLAPDGAELVAFVTPKDLERAGQVGAQG